MLKANTDQMAMPAGVVTFQRERFVGVIEEGLPLLHAQWMELAHHQSVIPLDPDWAWYEKADDNGLVRIFTARLNGRQLIGYAVFFVKKHPHYKTAMWAISDIFWLRQEMRHRRSPLLRAVRRAIFFVAPGLRKPGVGDSLFDFAERELQHEGVDVIHVVTKHSSPAAITVLKRRGYRLIEHGLSKLLRKG